MLDNLNSCMLIVYSRASHPKNRYSNSYIGLKSNWYWVIKFITSINSQSGCFLSTFCWGELVASLVGQRPEGPSGQPNSSKFPQSLFQKLPFGIHLAKSLQSSLPKLINHDVSWALPSWLVRFSSLNAYGSRKSHFTRLAHFRFGEFFHFAVQIGLWNFIAE